MFKIVVLVLNIFLLIGCERSAFEAVLLLGDMTVPSAAHSTMTVSDLNYADGVTPAKIEIRLKNKKAIPLAGVSPHVSISGTGNVLTPCTVTDAEGKSVCWLYSTNAETKNVLMVTLDMSEDLTFQAVSGLRGRGAIVSSGQSTRQAGRRITSISGGWHSSFQLNDSANVNDKRGETSILYIMPK